MEAIVCKRLGDPTLPLNSSGNSPLILSKSNPIPELNSPTAVRVRVRATSLNFFNYLQIQGKYQVKFPIPFVPGSDYSGIVDSVGPEVSKFRVGDRVCSFTIIGSFARFIVVDETELFRVPDGCDLVAAGALNIAYETSHVTLVHKAQLKPGQVLLVLGAAGGVGHSAVQIGNICGAIVIAVARGEEKVKFLKSLNADHVVDLSENVTKSVRDFLKGKKLNGVDVLYDPVGGKLTKESMKLLNHGAQILVIGFASGEVPIIPANIALVKNWTIHTLDLRTYNFLLPAELREERMKELMSWWKKGLFTIHISHVYSPSEANLAFSSLKDRKAIGKIIIDFEADQNRRSKL